MTRAVAALSVTSPTMRAFPWNQLRSIERRSIHAGRRLRRLLGAEATARLRCWAASFAGSDVALSESVASRCGFGHGVAFDLSGPEGQSGVAIVDPLLAGRLRAKALQIVDETPLLAPTAVERGLVGFCVAELLVELAGGWTLSLEPAQQLPLLPWWRVTLQSSNQLMGRLALCFDLHDSPSACVVDRSRRLAALRFTLPVVATTFRLSLEDVASLGLGDVIVPEDLGSLDDGTLRLAVGRDYFDAALSRRELTIQSSLRRGGELVSNESDGQAVAERLPVEVVVEVARLTIAGADAMALQPGDVLTVDRPTASAVNLTVGGVRFAAGELVDVEGELGVRIDRIFADAE